MPDKTFPYAAGCTRYMAQPSTALLVPVSVLLLLLVAKPILGAACAAGQYVANNVCTNCPAGQASVPKDPFSGRTCSLCFGLCLFVDAALQACSSADGHLMSCLCHNHGLHAFCLRGSGNGGALTCRHMLTAGTLCHNHTGMTPDLPASLPFSVCRQ